MSTRMVMTEDEAYELLAHLVASAEICTVEPHYYGTFRLIDAASRLMASMLKHGDGTDQAWLAAFKQEVDQKKSWMMWDREGYFQFLEEATEKLAEVLKRRAAETDEPVAALEGVAGDHGE